MALARVKVWGEEVLYPADLNAEFNNILNNILTAISPLTGTLDLDGQTITLDADGDLNMAAGTDDIVSWTVGSGSMKMDLATAAIVNGFTLTAAATGNPPILAASGTDTNIGAAIRGKGTGTVRIQNAAGTANLFIFDAGVASAVNGLTATSTAAAGTPSVAATGSDTDIALNLVSKGADDVLVNGVSVSDCTARTLENSIINSEFANWQRFGPTVTSTGGGNNDDVWFCDRFLILSDGNDIVDLSRDATVITNGATFSLKCDIETANKKFMIVQILEARDTERFDNGVASFSFQAEKTGSSFTAIRMAIVEWTGTADAVTSDMVNAWSVAGTNPTLVANWTYANTPGALTALTTDYQEYKLEGVTISTDVKNLAAVVWLDDVTTTVGDFLNIANWNLTPTKHCHPYYPPNPTTDWLRCMRYYEKTFSPDVAPADDTGNFACALTSQSATTGVLLTTWNYKAPKRVTPTVTLYNPRNGTNGQWTDASADLANASSGNGNEFGVQVTNTDTATGNVNRHYIHAAADAEL